MWWGGGASYLQFAEEPLDGGLAHGADLGAVQGDPGVGPPVGTRHLLQAHQALPGGAVQHNRLKLDRARPRGPVVHPEPADLPWVSREHEAAIRITCYGDTEE
jgi:hypothetical protein